MAKRFDINKHLLHFNEFRLGRGKKNYDLNFFFGDQL